MLTWFLVGILIGLCIRCTVKPHKSELEIEKEFFASGDTTYKLVPGIHVYVFILTGERTVLSYITTPFHNGVGQALQER